MKAVTLLLLLAAATSVLVATTVLAESVDSEQYGLEEFDDGEDVEESGNWMSRSLLQDDDEGEEDDDRSPPPPRRSPPPPRRLPPPVYSYRSPPPPPPKKKYPPPPPPLPRDRTCRTNRTLCSQSGSRGPDCCAGVCTDVSSDELNCGGCGFRCFFGRTCCGRASGCVDVSSNSRNCGMCNNVCPPVRGSSAPGRCIRGLCEYSG